MCACVKASVCACVWYLLVRKREGVVNRDANDDDDDDDDEAR